MKKQGLVILFTLMLIVGMVGCAKSDEAMPSVTDTMYGDSDMKSESVSEAPMEASEDVSMENETGTRESGGADLSNRKIIETRNIDMETEHFDTVLTQIEDLVYTSLGYIESSSIQGKSFNNNDEFYPRHAYYTLRVPAEYFKGFVDQLTGFGYVISNNVNNQDVTVQFMDIEARIKTMEVQEERLLALLEKSAKLDDILELERELADVRYEIESYTSVLNDLDNRVRFSTVFLELSEVFELVEKPAAPPKTFGDKISNGLSNTFGDIGDFFTNFTIWFVVNLPYILIWVVVIGGIVLFIRKQIRKINAETEAKKQAAYEASKVDKEGAK